MHGRTGRTSRPGGGSGPEGRRRCQRAGTLDQVLQDAVGKNDIDDKREHRRKSCFSAFPDGHQKDGKGDPDIAVIPQISHEFQKARQNRRAEGVLDQVQDSYIKIVQCKYGNHLDEIKIP